MWYIRNTSSIIPGWDIKRNSADMKELCDSQSARLVMKIEVFCYNNPAPKTPGVHAGQREDKRIGMK